jgi:hypothetical protein
MINWSPSEFMSHSPHYLYLLIQSGQMEAASFNALQDNLATLNAREVSREVYLIFSHETQTELSKRVFAGVAPASKAILALISDSASVPK